MHDSLQKPFLDLNNKIYSYLRNTFLIFQIANLIISSALFSNNVQHDTNLLITFCISIYLEIYVFYELCISIVHYVNFRRNNLDDPEGLNIVGWTVLRCFFLSFYITCICLLIVEELAFSIILWVSGILFLTCENFVAYSHRNNYTCNMICSKEEDKRYYDNIL